MSHLGRGLKLWLRLLEIGVDTGVLYVHIKKYEYISFPNIISAVAAVRNGERRATIPREPVQQAEDRYDGICRAYSCRMIAE